MTKSCNIILHVGNLILFPVETLHLIFFQFQASFYILIIISRIVLQFAVMHVDYVGADAIQEVLGVGYQHKDPLERFQFFFQPHAGIQVKVVCGLI